MSRGDPAHLRRRVRYPATRTRAGGIKVWVQYLCPFTSHQYGIQVQNRVILGFALNLDLESPVSLGTSDGAVGPPAPRVPWRTAFRLPD